MSDHRGNDRSASPASDGAPAPARLADLRHAATEPAEQLVARMLRAATPYQLPVGRRQRLRVDLAEALGRRRRLPLLAQWSLALALLAFVAGAVSAHLLDWPQWLAPREAPPTPATDVIRSPRSRPRARAATVVPSPPTTMPPSVDQMSTWAEDVALAPGRETQPASPPFPRRHKESARERSTAPLALAPNRATGAAANGTPPAGGRSMKTVRPATPEEDAALALAALTALRREHDPARARALLEPYLRDHPDGPIAEEALAITLEAALSNHDADTAALAARYLRLYPTGSFRALAHRAPSGRGQLKAR